MNRVDRGRRDLTLESGHDEISALTACCNRRVLDSFGFDLAVWIVSDDADVHRSLALLGRQERRRRRDDVEDEDVWQVVPLKAKRTSSSSRDETDDPECLARIGGWLYVFGSHFGSNLGPLDPERHFVARFNESLVKFKDDRLKTKLDVCRELFALHRAVNDAIAQRDLRLIAEGARCLYNYIRATIGAAESDHPEWRDRLHHRDRPINIEGTSFLPNDRLLVRLRYPVTADGAPILVEVDGIDRLFQRDGLRKFGRLKGTRVFIFESIGRPDQPAGFDAANAYHVFQIPDRPDYGVVSLRADPRYKFLADDNIEGVAVTDDGAAWFVSDDENIRMTILSR